MDCESKSDRSLADNRRLAVSDEKYVQREHREFGGCFITPVIHFGASFEQLWADWSAWLAKFEALLSATHWHEAGVVLSTEIAGRHLLTWQNPPGKAEKTGDPECWTFEGIRSFDCDPALEP